MRILYDDFTQLLSGMGLLMVILLLIYEPSNFAKKSEQSYEIKLTLELY